MPMNERTQAPQHQATTDSPSEDSLRTFDEKAVAEILQRAARLESKRSEKPTELSLAEIEQIARDSGIDPALVRQAVRDFQQQGDTTGFAARFTGAPLRRTVERVIDREITQDEHEALAADIREALAPLFTVPPQVSTLGRSLSFSTVSRRSNIDLQITPRDGKTIIRITTNATQLAGGYFGGIMGGVGAGFGTNVGTLTGTFAARALDLPVPLSVGIGITGFLGFVTGAYSVARALFGRSVARNNSLIDNLADQLEARIKAKGLPK